MKEKLSHLDEQGRARMVDISAKPETLRQATAVGRVRFSSEATLQMARSGTGPKGDVFQVARLAGILAAKRVDELIPLCHTLPINSVEIHFTFPQPNQVQVQARVKVRAATGVEMEALTAVSVACLTIYDMLKAVDKRMVIEGIHLWQKEGGKSPPFYWEESKEELDKSEEEGGTFQKK
ncbi:MAG: cyclic pyranopterin monophosphate synthase MoaC [Planctomycetota bacterium]|nr:MAG: cyclic pyranopterin monophosphate synthase MoaC [Planctomycetota bacterium]